MLEHFEFGTYLENGQLQNMGGWAVDYVPTGLEFADNDDLSMVYVETGDFKGVVIAYATKSGTELWCYDTVKLELSKMGVLDGVIDLVGLDRTSQEALRSAKVDYSHFGELFTEYGEKYSLN